MVCTVIYSFIFSLAKVASTASFWVSFCSTFQLSFGCDTRYYNCDSYGEFIAVVYFRHQKFSFQTYLERKNRKSESENRRRFMAPVSGACVLGLRAMNAFNVKCRFFRGMPAPRFLHRFSQKLAQMITSRTTPYMHVLRSISSKRACLRMREIVTLRRLFLFLMVHAHRYRSVRWTDQWSSSLTAQMARPRGIHVLFMVSLIKNIFSLFFTQKCEKLHYTLCEHWTAITLASLKIRTNCLQQTGFFGVAQSKGVIQIYTRLTLVAMATNRSYFNTKLAITRLRWKIRPWFLHLVGGFRGRPI